MQEYFQWIAQRSSFLSAVTQELRTPSDVFMAIALIAVFAAVCVVLATHMTIGQALLLLLVTIVLRRQVRGKRG